LLVRIAERVWTTWQATASDFDEPAITLLVAGPQSADEAFAAVDSAMRDLHEKYPLAGDPFIGEWRWVRGEGGVILEVVEPDDLEEVLHELAGALEARGVSGEIDVYKPPRIPRAPLGVDLVESRMRPNGKRLHHGEHHIAWDADHDALAAVAKLALDWCADGGRRGPIALDLGALPPVRLAPPENVEDRVLEELDRHFLVVARTLHPGSVRAVAIRTVPGHISMIETLPSRRAWREPLAEFQAVLRDAASALVYAYVKHGSNFSQAKLGDSVRKDWPRRPGMSWGSWPGTCAGAFEDRFAPDAFVVQLLGPGYAGRVEVSEEWRHEQIAPDVALLAHTRPEAWFDSEFIPMGTNSQEISDALVPPVLAEARQDLDPILLNQGHTGQ
jgi:hypothetical protein